MAFSLEPGQSPFLQFISQIYFNLHYFHNFSNHWDALCWKRKRRLPLTFRTEHFPNNFTPFKRRSNTAPLRDGDIDLRGAFQPQTGLSAFQYTNATELSSKRIHLYCIYAI